MTPRNIETLISVELGALLLWGITRDVVANVRDSDIVVSQFEFQWHYYIHFQTNTFEKPSYPQLWVE